MPPLKNNRHEKFALALFKGMSQKDAAIEAGYKPSRARRTASELVTKRDILARIGELHEMAASDAVMSVREREERLSTFGREDIRSEKGTLLRHGSISAIAELTKMKGEYPPSKVEIAGQGGGPIQIEDARAKLLSVLEAVAKRLGESVKQG